jgi:hypothetical protein
MIPDSDIKPDPHFSPAEVIKMRNSKVVKPEETTE